MLQAHGHIKHLIIKYQRTYGRVCKGYWFHPLLMFLEMIKNGAKQTDYGQIQSHVSYNEVGILSQEGCLTDTQNVEGANLYNLPFNRRSAK